MCYRRLNGWFFQIKKLNSKNKLLLSVVAYGIACFFVNNGDAFDQPPNIVVIYADDLGYGDVGCYNDNCKIPTPNLDRMAADGMRFTDAHSPATVCTTSRYGLLTGKMPFRINYGSVFTGVGGPCLIKENQVTLPGILQKKGYATACVGKWHVGMTFRDSEGTPITKVKIDLKDKPKDWREGGKGLQRVLATDFSKPITDGPIHRGFDYFFGTACCPTTDWLYAFIEQDRVVKVPTAKLDRTNLPKHAYSRDNRRGMIAEGFDLLRVDLDFLEKSKAWLNKHCQQNPGRPFFLFHSLQAVHLPSFAAKEFEGRSGAGPHGDFVFECDHIVGELLSELTKLGIAENTLVIFSSDNGPETTSVIHMRKDHNHDGANPWRGMKRDLWEGGHRVPFIVRWPAKVRPGTKCDYTVCQTDILHTCARLVGFDLSQNSAEDSFDIGPLLMGENQSIRPFTLHQGFGSKKLAIRQGKWKYLDLKGSGGNNYEKNENLRPFMMEDTDPDSPGQLYDLENDPGETTNVYSKHPEVAKRLKSLLEATKKSGRSR